MTKLFTTPKESRTCKLFKRTTNMTELLTGTCWFEASFRRRFAAGCMYFPHEGQKNDRSTKFVPAPVSKVEVPACREHRWIPTLKPTS